MKIVITETQILNLLEKINSSKVLCDKCGWSWKLSEGGDDPYICHKCGHNNSDEDYRGKNVMVYYNLHKHTFSVTYKSKVILHADYIKLKDVEFRVRGGGKEKVRSEKRKNVHAFVIGKLIDYCEFPCKELPNETSSKVITYDPYKYDSFVYKDNKEPVYKAKEVDMINHKNKIFVINEIKSHLIKESEEKPTKYTYTKIGLFEKFNTKRFYFNDIVAVDDDSPIPNKIKMYGVDGDFEFNENEIFIDMDKKRAYVDRLSLEKYYPSFELKNHKKLSETIGITSSSVREALEKAFPQNWVKQDSVYTPGLRGIYTIGEMIGDKSEDWSIMNYFDTKDEIHSLIYLQYFEDLKNGKEINDIVEWMSDLFKNNTKYTKLLVKRQWESIKRGLKLEKDSVNNFLYRIGTNNFIYYPHGSIMDRWKGVDVTVDDVNYQIKPLTNYTEEDGKYTVNTYGMRDYTSKKSVNKIVFVNKKMALVFDNQNYSVVSKNKVIFNEEPLILKEDATT
jgi:hypothetical protein